MKYFFTACVLAAVVACEPEANSDETDARLAALEKRVMELQTALDKQRTRHEERERLNTQKAEAFQTALDQMQELAALVPLVRVEGDSIIIEGANVHIRNSKGTSGSVDGTGNLIIGYNEQRDHDDVERTGSHNIIVGPGHEYASYGGFVGGRSNEVSGPYAVVLTGARNTANDWATVVVSGSFNVASGLDSVVTTGSRNVCDGMMSYIGTGEDNNVSGSLSAIVTGSDVSLNQDGVVFSGPDPLVLQ